MAQFPECLGLDLADALAGDVELLADFFQHVNRYFVSIPIRGIRQLGDDVAGVKFIAGIDEKPFDIV